MAKGLRSFNEILVVCDKQAWVWNFTTKVLTGLGKEHVRLPSSTSIRQSWQRFKDAERIIVHWETNLRTGGAIVEEILEIDPLFNVAERIMVLTTNPTHGDVVYFNELGLQKIVKLENRPVELERSEGELRGFIQSGEPTRRLPWQKLLRVVSHLSRNTPEPELNRVADAVESLHQREGAKPSAVYFDAMASLAFYRGQPQEALRLWQKALESNPNYFRTYNNLIAFYKEARLFDKALELMRKMQQLNKNSIQRMVQFGEVYAEMNDDDKAEHYFSQALEKDKYCSTALNGLAEIRFRQGMLDEARELLTRSSISYKTAAYLNRCGIELVKKNQYKEALEHYSKAQFVLPQQEKGPMLFYNIGLCYSRWGKLDVAAEFLKIALIKEPNYAKAQRLLEQIQRAAPVKAAS